MSKRAFAIQCGETFLSVPYNIPVTLYVQRCSKDISELILYPGKTLWAMEKTIQIAHAKKFPSYDSANRYLAKIANSDGMFIVEV